LGLFLLDSFVESQSSVLPTAGLFRWLFFLRKLFQRGEGGPLLFQLLHNNHDQYVYTAPTHFSSAQLELPSKKVLLLQGDP